uniref:Uncharacterized protein n=1 Tax=Hucho hucho TaxID=62062 RepID=A0A4W5JUC2_9TELE
MTLRKDWSMRGCLFRTPYGKEYEVTAHTFLDSHKAERDINHWLLLTADPVGAGLTLLDRP